MVRDVEYFKTRIGSLDGAGDTADYLLNAVKKKGAAKASGTTTTREETATQMIYDTKKESNTTEVPEKEGKEATNGATNTASEKVG